MKKVLLAIAAVATITSCSQNEEFENLGQKEEINFTPLVGKATRVTPLVTDAFETFTIYGYNVGTTDFNGTGNLSTAIFGPETYSKSAATWTGNTFYWPANVAEKLCFFAYSPASIKEYQATTGYPSFKYEVKAVESQEDLVVASNLNKARGTDVSLAFNHALIQLNFSAGLTTGFTYAITNISISGVNNSGTFTYSNSIGDWTAQDGTASYAYAGDFNGTITDNVLKLSTGSNALMLMPQTVPAGAEISITYTATANSTNQVTFNGTKKVAIGGVEWKKGSNICYKLILPTGAEAITYSTVVNPWGEEDSQDKTTQP